MSVRVEIQKKIVDLLEAGTFTKVIYSGRVPVDSVDKASPKSVVVNELSGGLTDSARTGATSSDFVLTNWRFECRAEFTCEVDISYFMLNELRQINLNVDNLLVAIVPSGDFRVVHPPRDGSHNGTKLIIGLTVNTRR